MTGPTETKCGYVTLVGRPNVGKSTMLNRILRQKLSITSRKPQTTRHRLLGIHTEDDVQMVFVDTPGIHSTQRAAMNRYMNRVAVGAMRGVDLVVMVVDRLKWQPDDDYVRNFVGRSGVKAILAVNKVDLIKDKALLLPYLEKAASWNTFDEVVPVSARSGHNIERLEQIVRACLPVGPHLFPDDQLTDRSERFLVAEIVREKITRQLGDELPYEATVVVTGFETARDIVRIRADIVVARKSQKGIIIGEQGKRLKKIGADARGDIERLLGCKAFLELEVTLKKKWSDSDDSIRSLGYLE